MIAWASHEDIEPYHGWVMAYDAATLKPDGAFCVTPEARRRHLAIGARRRPWRRWLNLLRSRQRRLGRRTQFRHVDSAVRRSAPNGLALEDYFTPHDYAALNERDADIGSTGPLLIPGTNRLIAGSKKGIFYVLDGHNLGHMAPDDHGLIQLLASDRRAACSPDRRFGSALQVPRCTSGARAILCAPTVLKMA